MQTNCGKINISQWEKILPEEKAGEYISKIVLNNAAPIDTQHNAME